MQHKRYPPPPSQAAPRATDGILIKLAAAAAARLDLIRLSWLLILHSCSLCSLSTCSWALVIHKSLAMRLPLPQNTKLTQNLITLRNVTSGVATCWVGQQKHRRTPRVLSSSSHHASQSASQPAGQPSIYLSMYLSLYLSMYLSIYLCITSHRCRPSFSWGMPCRRLLSSSKILPATFPLLSALTPLAIHTLPPLTRFLTPFFR